MPNFKSVVRDSAGRILFPTGSAGTADLSSGAATVNTPLITANSIIILTAQSGTLNAGDICVSSRVAGTSFTITSLNVLDGRTIGWILFEPE